MMTGGKRFLIKIQLRISLAVRPFPSVNGGICTNRLWSQAASSIGWSFFRFFEYSAHIPFISFGTCRGLGGLHSEPVMPTCESRYSPWMRQGVFFVTWYCRFLAN